MLRFLAKRQMLGIDISASAVRFAEVSGRTGTLLRFAAFDVPSGMVREEFGADNIVDPEGFTSLLRAHLALPSGSVRPAALSLPDAVFRVHVLEFDQVPPRRSDRERLVRWRLEKSGTVDMADTVLKHQLVTRPGKGHTVLACVAKQAVVRQYEQVLLDIGLEPWAVAPSSFHTANWYAPALAAAPVTALLHLRPDAVAALVFEAGEPVFYRYKDMKKQTGEVRARLLREIDDSLHFYCHMDRSVAQKTEVQRVLLSGDSPLADDIARELRSLTAAGVEVLAPLRDGTGMDGEGQGTIPGSLAPALGAGGSS